MNIILTPAAQVSLTTRKFLLDVVPSLTDLEEVETSTLYYICGYISMKTNIGLDAPEVTSTISEFTTKVSRGVRSSTLQMSSLISVSIYYKNVELKTCSNRLVKAFKEVYDCNYLFLDDIVVKDVLQGFVNCFSKGYANMKTEQIKFDKNNRRKRKALQYR